MGFNSGFKGLSFVAVTTLFVVLFGRTFLCFI